MGFVLDRIKSAIISAADAGTEFDQIGYGDPSGAKVSIEGFGFFERGKAWLRDKTGGALAGFLDFLTDALGAEFERAAEQGGSFNVNSSGVSPVILHNYGIASVTKHEVGIPPAGTCDYVDVLFSDGYQGGTLFTSFVQMLNVAGIVETEVPASNTVRIKATTDTGVSIDLNSVVLGVLAKGVPA